MTNLPLVAVDIGNTRVKFGLFEEIAESGLPQPARTLGMSGVDGQLAEVEPWLGRPIAEAYWLIACVNRPTTTRIVDWLRERQAADRTRLLASFDLPLAVDLPRPDMVGVDRLAGAVGVNALREPGRPAVLVDLGTAIKVDLVGPAGEFRGGAILPGIGTSARAMHEFTDLLPLLDMQSLKEAPMPVGTSTTEAMRSGLFWGAIGAAKELILQYGRHLGVEPQVLLSGGAAANVASLIAPGARYEPNLVLGGIALSAARLAEAEAGRDA